MNRYWSFTTLILPMLLAPFTVLILLSQNTVPGNLLYPYKRGLEFMILAAASLNPTTKAYFHADLSDRRYAEAESLILVNKDVSGLSSFVDEVKTTETAIQSISDPNQQKQLQQNLVAKIDNYQNSLVKVQTQVQAESTQQENVAPVVQQNNSVPTPTPVIIAQQQIVEKRVVIVYVTAMPGPSPTAVSSQFATPTPQQPTPTVPVAQNYPTAITVAISDTQDELKKIKEKVKRENNNGIKTQELKVTPGQNSEEDRSRNSSETKLKVDKHGN